MKLPRRRIAQTLAAAMLLAAGVALLVAACGDRDTVLTPAAFGADGHCYYIDSPTEVAALQAAGQCPASWTPAPAPLVWHERYFSYYSSPAYVNIVIAAPARAAYLQRSRSFGNANAQAIRTAANSAVWRSSSGKTVTGPPTGRARFGGGAGRTPSFGGGAARGPVSTRPVPARPAAPARPAFGGGAARGR